MKYTIKRFSFIWNLGKKNKSVGRKLKQLFPEEIIIDSNKEILGYKEIEKTFGVKFKDDFYKYIKFISNFYKKYWKEWYNGFSSVDEFKKHDYFPDIFIQPDYRETKDILRNYSFNNEDQNEFIQISTSKTTLDSFWLYYNPVSDKYSFDMGMDYDSPSLKETLIKHATDTLKLKNPKREIDRKEINIIQEYINGLRRL